MSKFLTDLLSKVVEHYVFAILAIILPAGGILEFYTRYKPLSTYVLPFLRWYWTPWIMLVALLLFLLSRRIYRAIRKNEQYRIEVPPKYYASHDQRLVDRRYAGVIWKVMVGSDAGPAMSDEITEDSVRVWLRSGPYCPECDFELERVGKKWYCIPCSRNYPIPHDLRIDTWIKMRKVFQRYVRRLAPLNYQVADEPQVPFHRFLSEQRASRQP